MNIRTATFADEAGLLEICLDAFDGAENELVARLASELLTTTSSPETITLVAEADDSLLGFVSFSPVRLNHELLGYILAPLAVKSDGQRKGIGTKLVESGLHRLKQQNIRILFVYGDPRYYSRFGFAVTSADRYTPPYPLQYPAGWQAIEFTGDASDDSGGVIECVPALHKPELW
ncbi:MAG: N-acetyltransferase [Verrucomicrobiota bacterium]